MTAILAQLTATWDNVAPDGSLAAQMEAAEQKCIVLADELATNEQNQLMQKTQLMQPTPTTTFRRNDWGLQCGFYGWQAPLE
ncbi:MAG: hypothetical protein WBM04_08535 [Candidatus Korobacteraceae bacterium]